MKNIVKDKSYTLFTKKSNVSSNNDNDNSCHVDTNYEKYKNFNKIASNVVMIMKHFNKFEDTRKMNS